MPPRTSTALPSARLAGWRAGVAWLVPIADIAILILVAVFIPRDADPIQFVVLLLTVAAFGFVGGIVVVHQSTNAIGWILWIFATLITIGLAGSDYAGVSAERLGGSLPGTVVVAWLSSWIWVPAIALTVIFVPLLFPNGQLPSLRWRPVLWYAVAATAAASLSALRPGPLSNVSDLQNPFGVPGAAGLIDALGFPPAPEMLVVIPVAIASLFFRYRRGDPIERQQLKWFASFAVVTALGFALAPDELSFLSFASLALLPVAIGIAILRYRLYDIDRIISRTAVYVPLTAVLAGLYAASIALLQRVFIAATGGPSDGAVILSTLVLAATFTPIKNALQAFVDRRFRDVPDADRRLAAFVDGVAGAMWEPSHARVMRGFLGEVVRAVDASGGAAYIATPGGEALAGQTATRGRTPSLVVPVASNGRPIGRLELDERRRARPYTERTVELLQTAGEHLAEALVDVPERPAVRI